MQPSFRNARKEERGTILALYKSVLGSEFCAWNDAYPGMLEIDQDIAEQSLFVLAQGERIVGAISVVPENELDGFACWACRDGSQKEIARVVVARDSQDRGLAYEMVQKVTGLLQSAGCKAIHLSVVKSNLPACKTYIKAGFQTVGEASMYGNSYYLMEKHL